MNSREHAPTKPDDRAARAHFRAESRGLIVVGVLLIAANLRAPFTGLPPVLALIREDFALSTAAASALTTLPLLAFALVSPISAPLARTYGLERTLFGALVSIALGIVLRSAGTSEGLFLGTCIIGTGIAVGNVLLPSLVKRDFPSNVAELTGGYALAMGVSAALGSAAAVPLAHAWGWRGALAASLVLPLLALGVWSARFRAPTALARDTASPLHGGRIWHSALAWQVTLFLGLNSTIYYVAISWLPTILVDAGVSPATAGSMHGLMQLATAVPGLLLGSLVTRMPDQRLPAAVAATLSAIALLGLLAAPSCAALWAVLFGVGTGAGIMLGLMFVGLRTSTVHEAATLSGMAQSIGYLLAAVGPMAVGALHDALGGWSISLGICTALALLAAVMGVLAGRSRHIRPPMGAPSMSPGSRATPGNLWTAQKSDPVPATPKRRTRDAAALGLPTAPKPVGNYRAAARSGNLVFINQIALKDGKVFHPGVIGKDVSLEQAREATKQTMQNVLAVLADVLEGDLDRVERCVQLTGIFNTPSGFTEHAQVMNAASDYVVEVLGDAGPHARGTLGAASLPLNSAVEIQAVFEVR